MIHDTALRTLRRRGVLSALDAELARSLHRLSGSRGPDVALAVALLSRCTREGHVRLDLEAVCERPIVDAEGSEVDGIALPDVTTVVETLEHCGLASPERASPLVIEDSRYVYLRRYHEHEVVLARELLRRATEPPREPDAMRARQDLERLFPSPAEHETLQLVATMVASLRGLAIVTGGPGTGKTTTVVKIVAMLLGQLVARGAATPQVALLAPTGKAAARLSESVTAAASRLALPGDVRALLPTAASTIHRALGVVSELGRRPVLRELAADIVVVDEASMVDIALMRTLVDATPARASLVLLGDAGQLASVEAGAVLADLAGPTSSTRLSGEMAKALERAFGRDIPASLVSRDATPLSDGTVHLVHSHRFGADSGIGELANAVRQGDREATSRVLSKGPRGGVMHHEVPPRRQLSSALAEEIRSGFAPALRAGGPLEALRALSRFRVLCAHRRGNGGVEAVNAFAERVLADAGLVDRRTPYYEGRVILITRNDPGLGLFNGDVGVVWRRGDRDPRVHFPSEDGVRALAPSRLPAHETAFAMSIHKSQGSEFDHVTVLLPEASSPLLCRELLYTAVTRARTRVTLFATAEALDACCRRRIARESGLLARLHDASRRDASPP